MSMKSDVTIKELKMPIKEEYYYMQRRWGLSSEQESKHENEQVNKREREFQRNFGY